MIDPGEACDDGLQNGSPNACDFTCGFQCQGACPLRVDVDAAPGGDGSSWARAFDTVQAALDFLGECSGGELWVAEGTYVEDAQTSVATITSDVQIYGGFSGVETLREQRDWDAHATIFGQAGMQTSVVVVLPTLPISPARLDGIEITGGSAASGGGLLVQQTEGGVFPDEASLVIANSWVHDNHASDLGGGMRITLYGRVDIFDSIFEANHADGGGGAIANTQGEIELYDSKMLANTSSGSGGAIHQPYQIDNYVIFKCVDSEFVDNAAGGAGGAVRGGEANTTDGCRFINNSAGTGGGALSVEAASVKHSHFEGNVADASGGAINAYDLVTADSDFVGNQALAGSGGAMLCAPCHAWRSTFIANAAASNGGAIHTVGAIQAGVLRNVTFIDNTAGDTAGAVYGWFDMTLATLRNNSAGVEGDEFNGGAGLTQSIVRGVAAWPDPIVVPVVVEFGEEGNIDLKSSCVVDGTNNLEGAGNVLLAEDPFIEADLDDDGIIELYIDPSSPCHDIGGPLDAGQAVYGQPAGVLTTDIMQCTDGPPLDAGRHYVPLDDVGVCP